MKPLAVAELTHYSPWPERLTDDASRREERTLSKLTREYDSEKYPALIAYLAAHPDSGWEEVRALELGLTHATELPVSVDGELFLAMPEEARRERERRYIEAFRPYMDRVDTIIDLGTGYGYNLMLLAQAYPGHTFVGGEFSPRAIELSAQLPHADITLFSLNLFDTSWSALEQVPGDRLLITSCHAIEMLPNASRMLDALRPYRTRIAQALQFEPLYERNDDATPLGHLRRRYTEVNDYNRDLYATLANAPDIALDDLHDDQFGLNPLFPESRIAWHFV